MERRGLTERKSLQQEYAMTQSMEIVPSRLERLGKVAKEDKHLQFNNLLHHITSSLLHEAFYLLNRQATKGVDNVGWHEYAAQLEPRLIALHERIHRGKYKPKPVKRLWLPKGNGEQRPIGITALEDKIVQQAVVLVLTPIYEADFLGFSYGFRPNRNKHQALDAVYMAISHKKVSWVLDADLKGFFDAIDHEWLQRFIAHRVTDKRVQRLIKGWLKAGVMDGHTQHKSRVGTPQGAVISPLLANIYLHYVLDLWVHQWRQRHARGEVYIIRYADDFVVGFQYQDDGRRLLRALEMRLGEFKLSLNKDKTHLIEFGRFAISNRQQRGVNKPETFDFLGFTHICAIRRDNGSFKLLRESIKKKLRSKIKQISERLMQHRHKPLYEMGVWVRKVLTGYYNYFAIPGNHASIQLLRTTVNRAWLKALRRRSHKGRKFNWCKMQRWINQFSPHTRVRHPYPNQRFHL